MITVSHKIMINPSGWRLEAMLANPTGLEERTHAIPGTHVSLKFKIKFTVRRIVSNDFNNHKATQLRSVILSFKC